MRSLFSLDIETKILLMVEHDDVRCIQMENSLYKQWVDGFFLYVLHIPSIGIDIHAEGTFNLAGLLGMF